MSTKQRRPNRYDQIIERIFLSNFTNGDREVSFTRDDLVQVAHDLGIILPKNLGDVIYSFRYRTELPDAVREHAPPGESWIILPAGRARYKFSAISQPTIEPNTMMVETKVPDSTPGVISMYALSDEQALLARLRYNRLIDIFTGVACYSLQNHLRTTVPSMGQVETDEIYIGVDVHGVHYVFPVQAKGGNDRLSVVQVQQDVGLCAHRFPSLVCRPIAAQFMAGNLIALFSFETRGEELPRISAERHYRLVPHEEVSPEVLAGYQLRSTKE